MGSAAVQVFVANIAWKTTEDDIRLLFEDNGEQVENVRIMMGDDGRSRGFGFVTFSNGRTNPDTVIAKMDGIEIGGRPLKVEKAKGYAKRVNG